MFAAIASVFALAILSVPHCAAMCGPLASCASKGSSRSAIRYQLGRLIGYGTIGGFAGALGGVLFSGIATWASAGVAWFAAVVLLVAAVRSWRSKARSSGPALHPLPLHQLSRGSQTRSRSASSRLIAFGVRLLRQHPGMCGGMTALLPCGVLWAAVVIALSSGSIVAGVITMVVFAALTAVSITVASVAIGQLRSRFGAKPMAVILALSAVFFIVLPLPQLTSQHSQPADRADAVCPLHSAAASFTPEKDREPTRR